MTDVMITDAGRAAMAPHPRVIDEELAKVLTDYQRRLGELRYTANGSAAERIVELYESTAQRLAVLRIRFDALAGERARLERLAFRPFDVPHDTAGFLAVCETIADELDGPGDALARLDEAMGRPFINPYTVSAVLKVAWERGWVNIVEAYRLRVEHEDYPGGSKVGRLLLFVRAVERCRLTPESFELTPPEELASLQVEWAPL